VVVLEVVVDEAGGDGVVVVVVDTEEGPLGPGGGESPQATAHSATVATATAFITRFSMKHSLSFDDFILVKVTAAPPRFRP
jgi:hypothetical protein